MNDVIEQLGQMGVVPVVAIEDAAWFGSGIVGRWLLTAWTAVLPPDAAYEGNALDDTEALYDDV